MPYLVPTVLAQELHTMPESKYRKRNDNIHKNEFAGRVPRNQDHCHFRGRANWASGSSCHACRLGADAAMEKPFDSKELLNTVKEPLRK
jgi:hypothetical protein